jgi:hypothetical protein
MSDEARLSQQVDDLRERMKLLQGDRRANIEIIQANKDSNKDEMSRLREENKEIRVKIASVQRSGSNAGDMSDADIEALQLEVGRAHKTYDTLRLTSGKNKKELQEFKDEVKQLEVEARRPNQEDSPLTRNIRMLENRLDKAMVKYNEAQSIRKTYEQIVKRLKEERVGFDSQLGALERTFHAKSRDYEELLLLSADANHARDVAKAELDRVRTGYEDERRRRETELRERHQELALRRQTSDLVAQREQRKAELKAVAASKADGYEEGWGEGEEALRQAAAVNQMTAQRIAAERKEHRAKIDIFEQAFRKIKDATGVSDVNEVIQKIVSQEGTTENLMLLTKENQAKIRTLTKMKEEANLRVEEVKYAGPGGGHRRKLVDDLEEKLAAETAKLERARTKAERAAAMLIAVKAGVKHLADKAAPAQHDLGLHIPEAELTDGTVGLVLSETEKVMFKLLQRVRAARAEEACANMGGAASDDALLRSAHAVDMGDLEDTILVARPHNQRIELPSLRQAIDDDEDEVGEEALSREKVKRASNVVLLKEEKKAKKKKEKAAF